MIASARHDGVIDSLLARIAEARLLARDPRAADALRELGLTQICHHCSPRQFPSLGSLFGSSGSRSSRTLDMS